MTWKYASVTILALCLSAGASYSQSALDMANEYPSGTIHADIVNKFIAEVSETTGGGVRITAHHGGSLGYKSVDHFDAVGDGAVPLASSYSGAWSGLNPIFLASSLPFLATSLEDTRALYEATRPYYEAAFEQHNQMLLYATPWPPSGLWGRKAIVTLEDLAHLKVRASDALGIETLRNAGASPVQLSWGDVVPQLTTGAIDGVLTSADGGVSARFWEYLSHFTEINYALPLQVAHMNRDVFEALGEEEQAAILAAAKAAEDYGWNLVVERVEDNYATLRGQGITVTTEISAELETAFKEAAQPVVGNWASNVGADADAILEQYRSSIGR